MRTAIGLFALFIGLFAAVLLQEAIPPVNALHGARFILVPLVFCYAAAVLPFPAMLAGAVWAGLLSDLSTLSVVGGRVEIALGWSIVYFVIAGCVAQGLQPSVDRGRWWVVIPLCLVATSLLVILQYAMISLRREGFVWDEDIIWRALAPGFLAGLLVPVLHHAVDFVAGYLPGLSRRERMYPL